MMPCAHTNTMRSPGIGQRVHNAYHHLEDCTLPYELWTTETELAALVHLLRRRSLSRALEVYPRLLRRYNASNQRFGVKVRRYDAYEVEHQVRRTSAFCSRFPADVCDSKVYVSLLEQLDCEAELAAAA